MKIIREKDRKAVIDILSDMYLKYAVNGVSISDTGTILRVISMLVRLLGGDKAIENLSCKLDEDTEKVSQKVSQCDVFDENVTAQY